MFKDRLNNIYLLVITRYIKNTNSLSKLDTLMQATSSLFQHGRITPYRYKRFNILIDKRRKEL